jgi:hypothetical protein
MMPLLRPFLISILLYASTITLPGLKVTVDKVSVLDVAQDRLQLAFVVTLVSDSNVAVRQVTFDNFRLNDVPLYVSAVTQPLSLKANQPQQLPEPLKVTLYFRDLDSVRPLQTALAEKRAHVEGTVYVEGEMPVLGKLLFMGSRVRVPVTLREDIPLNVPENKTLQSVAAKALDAVAASFGPLSSLAESLRRRGSSWRDDLWKDVGPALLLGYVRFTLKTKKGERQDFEYTGTGYRISANQFILCKSLVEPWKFDPDVASAIKFGGMTLDTAAYDVWVWPRDARVRDDRNELNPATAFRLGQSDFRRVVQPADENAGFFALQPEGRPKKIDLHKRSSASNLVLFEFRNPPSFSGQMKKSLGDSKAWDRVAVFRFPGGVSDRQARADLIFVPASRAGAMIMLETPLDSTAWGSPVVSQEGIIGLLQDQASAVPLKDALDVLKVK